MSLQSTERLIDVGPEPSDGNVGDSDDAVVETSNGLFKTEVIRWHAPCRSFGAVEYAPIDWIDWRNNRRLPKPSGNIPPVEAEAHSYAQLETVAMAA